MSESASNTPQDALKRMAKAGDRKQWRILSVEDDTTYQASLIYALDDLVVNDLPVEILTANSAAQAAPIIAETPDIAVILLDVVMEQDDAGLRLVSTIRDIIGNSAVRIILLTGQPGMAPRDDIMSHYDIDDYWCKSDLSIDQLSSLVVGNIRTWNYISLLNRARQGLQLLVDACQSINSKRDLKSFTHTVLEQISQLIGISEGGIVCIQHSEHSRIEDSLLIASSGKYSKLAGQKLASVPSDQLQSLIRKACTLRQHIYETNFSVFYFSSHGVDQREYVTLVETSVPMNEQHQSMLQVFSENVSTGFTNIALYNRLTELAYRDPLLLIHNRNWLQRELSRMSVLEYSSCWLLLVDLDDFADMGVTFGESFCDEVIKSFYHQLQDKLPDTLDIARISRSSLAVLLDSDKLPDGHSLEEMLNQPLKIVDQTHAVSTTIASIDLRHLANHPAHQILRLAESTIDIGRRQGRHLLAYSASIEHEIAERHSLLSDLRVALDNDGLDIELQPKVDLETGKIIGFEALSRWHHRDGRNISPELFIPIAETSGLISRLDTQVLIKSCIAARRLKEAGFPLPIAFNVSGHEFNRPEYFDHTLELLQDQQVTPDMLELEMTETQAMDNYEEIAPQLRGLIGQGMAVSLDDFGTGYSSLAYLTDLPATTLKIDKTFVSRLGEHAPSQVVDVILRLGHNFHYQIIAEGVETEEQRLELIKRGCRIGQGFLFSRSVPVDEALEMVRQGRSLLPESQGRA